MSYDFTSTHPRVTIQGYTVLSAIESHTKMSGQARGDSHISSKRQATSRAPTRQQALKTQLYLSWDQSPWPVNSLISLKTVVVPLVSPFS